MSKTTPKLLAIGVGATGTLQKTGSQIPEPKLPQLKNRTSVLSGLSWINIWLCYNQSAIASCALARISGVESSWPSISWYSRVSTQFPQINRVRGCIEVLNNIREKITSCRTPYMWDKVVKSSPQALLCVPDLGGRKTATARLYPHINEVVDQKIIINSIMSTAAVWDPDTVRLSIFDIFVN